jgi:hypothetical protein
MAAWRRKALEAFPELRRELSDAQEIYSAYALWFELLPLVRDAHREENADLLRRIYGFAEWCYRAGPELRNAVAVSFYEHLLDERWMRPLVSPWLTAEIVRDIRPLWEARLVPRDMRDFEDALRRGLPGSSS